MNPASAIWSQLSSRKFWNVALGGAAIFGSLLITWGTYTTPASKALAYSTAIGTFAALCGLNIHGIWKEDVARNTPPQTQINQGSTVSNVASPPTQTDPPPNVPPVTSPAPPPAKPRSILLTADAVKLLNELAEKAKAP